METSDWIDIVLEERNIDLMGSNWFDGVKLILFIEIGVK